MVPGNELKTTEEHGAGDEQLNLKNFDGSLDAILRSPGFRDSVQLQTLLKYLVGESLRGNDDALKERIIGMVVFGRRPDYDTAADPIVRSRMGLLRKRLAQYYEREEAGNADIQIVIPNGTYRPTFLFHPRTQTKKDSHSTQSQQPSAALAQVEDHHEDPMLILGSESPRRNRWLKWGVAAVVMCVLLAAWIGVVRSKESELALLWKPILESKKTVILYIGTVGPAYLTTGGPNVRTTPSGDEDLPASEPLPSTAVGPNSSASNFVLVPNGLAPPGDITADLHIAALMNTYKRGLSLRTRPDLPFVDMQGSPVVLVGAYDNYWTLNLGQDLPFFFDRGQRIRERGGQHRVWRDAPNAADATINEDYAVVFRLLDSKTGGPVLAVAGLTTCGTQAAADFVTDPGRLKKLAGIPRSALERKNIEFVLRASLVNCTPTSIDVVAQQVW